MADLGGAAFADAYLIDTHKDAFFLLSDKSHTVRVATKTASGFQVRVLLEDADVIRPIGDVALVQHRETRVAEVIDLEGNIVLDGVWTDALGEDPPVDQPEYWWLTDYFDRPAPMCTKTPRECGWVDANGQWLAKQPGPAAPPMLRVPVARGESWFALDGDELGLSEHGSERSSFNEGLALVGTGSLGDDSRPVYKTVVVDAETGSTTPVSADLKWEHGTCALFSTGIGCRYTYHQGLVAVAASLEDGHGQKQVYIDAQGQVAIHSKGPCPGDAPSGPFHQDRAFHCDPDGYWLIDLSGARLKGPWKPWKSSKKDRNSYYNGLHFSDGLAAVPAEGGWAYVDLQGNTVLPGPYEIARPFRLGFAQVKQDGEVKFIDKEGKQIFK